MSAWSDQVVPRCERVVALMTDYLDGALPAEDGARLEQHLATCAACREYIGQLRELSVASRDLIEMESVPPLPAEVVAGLTRALRSHVPARTEDDEGER